MAYYWPILSTAGGDSGDEDEARMRAAMKAGKAECAVSSLCACGRGLQPVWRERIQSGTKRDDLGSHRGTVETQRLAQARYLDMR